MRGISIVLFLWAGCTHILFAQFSDDFTDGDFTANSIWTGDDTKFEIDASAILHLNAPAVSDHACLSTPSQAIEDAVWEFYVEIGENPSSTNFANIYLVSDQPDLSGMLNGYFVKVGGSTDEVSLCRQDGSVATEIIDGLDDRVNMKPVMLRVKVTRNAAGNWELLTDNSGGTDYVSEGTVTDNSYLQSAYFGVYCEYTSTRSDKFYLDDFVVSGNPFTDNMPPEVLFLEVLSADSLRLQFSEALSTWSAENNSNYDVEGISPHMTVLQDSNRILLTFAAPFVNGSTHTLTIANVADTSGNTLLPVEMEFTYFEAVPATYREIVINEIFPDPNPQVDSLPPDSDAEFIELYNNSDHPFDLEGWLLNNAALPAFLLLPNQYVIVCKNTYETDFGAYGNVIGLSNWAALSNSGATILLKDQDYATIDSLVYSGNQISGGYSLEQIRPIPPCLTADNFTLSTHSNGATPGMQNATFNDATDTIPPNLISVAVDSVNKLSLLFDEILNETSRGDMNNYAISGGINVAVLQAEGQQAILTLNSALEQGQAYMVSVTGITDCSGNVVANNNLSFLYDVQPPAISQIIVLDTSTLEVIWDEAISKTLAEKEEYYSVDQNINPLSAKLNIDDSLKVTLLFGEAFDEGVTHLLNAIQISDTLGNAIPDSIPASSSFTFRNQVDSVVVVDGNLLEVYFTEPVREEPGENIENYEVDRNVGHPGVGILSEDKRRVSLIFGHNFSENKEHTLTISHILNTSGSLLSTPAQRFIYDTQAPKITSITVLTANSLTVTFDEKLNRNSAEKHENYQVVDLGNPVTAKLQEDGISVMLKFSENFVPEIIQQLTVNSIEDLEGNAMTHSQTSIFVYDPLPPSVTKLIIVSPQHLRLIFSEPLHPSSSEDADFYQIDHNIGKPDSVILSKVNPAWIDLIFGNSFQDDINYTLTVQNLLDLKGNVMEDPVTLVFSNQFPSLADIIPLSATEVRIRFSKKVQRETAENPDNYLLDPFQTPEKAVFNPAYPAEVKLLFSESFMQKKEYALTIENISDDKGNTSQTLRDTFVYDTKISSIHLAGNNVMQIDFTVPLEHSSTTNSLNFSIDQGYGHPETTVLNENNQTQLTLYFHQDFAPNMAYHLTVSNLKDTLGQWIPASTNLFGSGEKPGFDELLITEIMADPTPPLGLPEADYLEIYNPTEKTLDLQGLQLSDATTTAFLPDVLLQPGEYAILCASGNVDDFLAFGKAIGVSNFPALNNAEDEVSLLDEEGKLIFHITYQDDWYKDSQKAQGGWSLEMIDTARPCGEDENWTASEDPLGGTPGRENLVSTSNPDGMGPFLIDVMAISDTSIQLTFNETLRPSGIFHGTYVLDRNIGIDSIQAGNDLSEVLLQLQESLQPNTAYTLQVENVSDCNGNLISTTNNTFTFYLPEVSDSLDILLNEVLFAPRSGGEKFVELYNHSAKYINLKNWQLANITDNSVSNLKLITSENIILAPGAFLVLTEDATILQADYPQTRTDRVLEVAALPGYPVSEGAVVLMNDRDEVVQIFEYTADFHFPLLKETKGVSLERISWEEQVNDPNNWHSAASSAGYATPGYMNSQYRKYEKISAPFEVEPRVFLPDNSGQADFTSIRYQWEEPGHVATIRIFDASGRKVRDLVQNATLSTEDAIQWDGTDNDHQKVKMGYYLIYIEVFHLNGDRQVFKEKVVVAARF